MCKKLLVVVLVLGLAGSTFAATYGWDNGNGNRLWTDPINWDADILPGAGDVIYITDSTAAGNGPILYGTASAKEIYGFSSVISGGGEMLVDGGTLNIISGLKFSWNNDQKNTLTIQNGGLVDLLAGGISDLNLAMDHYNYGYINILSGSTFRTDSVVMAPWGGATGDTVSEINISGPGSLLEVNAMLFINGSASGHTTVDVSDGGVLAWKGSRIGEINAYVAAGKITADGGAGTVVVWEDGTFTYAVPEPATMMLLSLGGLALIRRKRAQA